MTAPFRSCLLSGGASRRMGRDKALLPHPDGGTWLERSLALLLTLGQPVTLLSRHDRHRELAHALADRAGFALTAIAEPPPWEGPLLALARLMERHPGERLLLCPVDMPWLDGASLRALVAAAAAPIHLAHDGQRLQPLLGLYPATADRRRRLQAHLATGERRLLGWLAGETWVPVHLPAGPLRNVNRPEELGSSLRPRPALGP
jgi:molybdopterin-guanine dinucleotide biosynthesis protein A